MHHQRQLFCGIQQTGQEERKKFGEKWRRLYQILFLAKHLIDAWKLLLIYKRNINRNQNITLIFKNKNSIQGVKALKKILPVHALDKYRICKLRKYVQLAV